MKSNIFSRLLQTARNGQQLSRAWLAKAMMVKGTPPYARVAVLVLCFALLAASSSSSPAQMKADYVEACSCHAFCPCYFNKQAEHPYCQFNMAVKVREGHSGNVKLDGAKYWLTGDLGDEWGTAKKGKWVVVSFDPATTKEQRDALGDS